MVTNIQVLGVLALITISYGYPLRKLSFRTIAEVPKITTALSSTSYKQDFIKQLD